MLAAILAASMLMTTPGLSIYAADLTDEEIIESCEEAAGEMEIAGDTQEDSAYVESEIAEEAEEQPGEVLTEITEEPAENVEPAEVDTTDSEEREHETATVDMPEKYAFSAEDMSAEETVGSASGEYTVGDGVQATFDSVTGGISLYSTAATGGTLWADWLEKAGIDRDSVKSISVKQQNKVRLPADAQGFMGDNNYLLFGGLKNLTRIDLKGFDTSNVTNMSYLFFRCGSLKSLNLKSFNTSKVTNMRCMFAECRNLMSVNLKSFNTLKVTNTHGMFDGCISLPGIDLSSFNTSNVTDMYRMFGDCTSLNSIDLSNFHIAEPH